MIYSSKICFTRAFVSSKVNGLMMSFSVFQQLALSSNTPELLTFSFSSPIAVSLFSVCLYSSILIITCAIAFSFCGQVDKLSTLTVLVSQS